jgi:hypothetical protein
MDAIDWLLRSLVVVDFALLVLTAFPTFSGIGSTPSVADRWWGHFRLAGLRPLRDPGPARTTALLCRLWLPFAVVYLGYALLHMFG